MSSKRIRDWGITIGSMKPGKLNRITDVPGVKVGHYTVSTEEHNTGVTVILPCEENPFIQKLTAASFVLNGFGKTCGLIQVDELGTLETPIALTNTLNVGLVSDAMVEYMVQRCKNDGVQLTSVNPVVCECNDSGFNRIAERVIGQNEVFSAIKNADTYFEEGAVGCGRGTKCYGLKGGVGSSSRVINLDGEDYTIGVLVQTNYGRLTDLSINGERIGEKIDRQLQNPALRNAPDKGSCIVILATDIPLSDRQLKRLVRRCSVGLARLGSYISNGSGEVFVGFTTANRIPLVPQTDIVTIRQLSEGKMDLCFRAAGECTEEAILNSMAAAEPVKKLNGETIPVLSDYLS